MHAHATILGAIGPKEAPNQSEVRNDQGTVTRFTGI
jgi:hypothetical protein